MSACDCSYPGHPKFLAAVVVLDNPIIGMMVRGRVAGSSPLVVVSGGVVMRRVQSIAKVVGDVAVLSHRVFHLVDGLKRRTSKTAKSEIGAIRSQASRAAIYHDPSRWTKVTWSGLHGLVCCQCRGVRKCPGR